jgi:hypothetical protein
MKNNSGFDANKIASDLLKNLKPIHKLHYTNKPGIYAVGYKGFIAEEFPWEPVRNKINDNPIIYIGNTQSFSASTYRNEVFASGKSETATFRRAIGAILQIKRDLHPIPRSNTEKSDQKYENYKFLNEHMMTLWMYTSLSLSFWKYEGSLEKLKNYENQLIQTIVPPLNIKNNPENKFSNDLKVLQNICAELAKANDN